MVSQQRSPKQSKTRQTTIRTHQAMRIPPSQISSSFRAISILCHKISLLPQLVSSPSPQKLGSCTSSVWTVHILSTFSMLAKYPECYNRQHILQWKAESPFQIPLELLRISLLFFYFLLLDFSLS